jgi:hypothetical protein
VCYGASSAASEAASAAVTALEAAWALTNLAAADHDIAQTVLPAAPALILHLGGGSGMPVAQQAAWALGTSRCAHHQHVLARFVPLPDCSIAELFI